jgi:hypothetical protein
MDMSALFMNTTQHHHQQQHQTTTRAKTKSKSQVKQKDKDKPKPKPKPKPSGRTLTRKGGKKKERHENEKVWTGQLTTGLFSLYVW